MVFFRPLRKNGKALNPRTMRRFIASLGLSLMLILPASASYSDVSPTHPYIEGISYVELQGAADSSQAFRPDDILNRAEAYKLLFEVLQIEAIPNGASPFEDAPADAWFAPYANLALEHELISDRSPLFLPEKQIRRLDALKILMQAYGLSTPVIDESKAVPLFQDVDLGSPAYAWIYQLEQVEIMEVNPSTRFDPYAPITRGEFAQWLYEFDAWLQNFKLDEYEATHSDFYKSEIFESVWNQVTNNHYLEENQSLSEDALFQAALKGLVESLNDPYSVYFSPEEAEQFTQNIAGEFEGIGAILDQDETGNVVIRGVLKGGPAEAAGLLAGDVIRAVDGVNVEGLALENVVARIKGPEGTEVQISVEREGAVLLFTLKRAHIEVVLQSGHIKWGDTWVIDIDSFSVDLPGSLMAVIQDLEAQMPHPEAIVLDLRGNPGGSLRSATFTSGLFVPELTPLVELNYGGYSEVIHNGDWGPYKDHPLYILMDEGSASASEIVALTLQEQGATVIGHQSFGKGTAQTYLNYWDGSALKLTIAEWLSGGGQSIDGIGVTPDVVMDADASESEWWETLKQLR